MVGLVWWVWYGGCTCVVVFTYTRVGSAAVQLLACQDRLERTTSQPPVDVSDSYRVRSSMS